MAPRAGCQIIVAIAPTLDTANAPGTTAVGEQAAAFLQGQLTQDVVLMKPGEARLAGYREDLTRTAEELTLLASDPDRLGARPTMSIPPDEVISQRGGPTAASAPR